MRLPPIALIAFLALATGLAAGCGGSSSESSSTGATSTPTSTVPAGASARACPRDVGAAHALRATGVSCGEAQRLAGAWQRDFDCAATAGGSHTACTVRGYRCIGTVSGHGLSVSCARPGRSVAFTLRG